MCTAQDAQLPGQYIDAVLVLQAMILKLDGGGIGTVNMHLSLKVHAVIKKATCWHQES